MIGVLKRCRKCHSKKISLYKIRNANNRAFYYYECDVCGNQTSELFCRKENAFKLWNLENGGKKKCLVKK